MFVDNFVPVQGHQYGQAGGDVINTLLGSGRGMRFESDLRRPFLNDRGVACVRIATGRTTLNQGVQTPIKETVPVANLINQGVMPAGLVTNATTLRKEEWLELDRVVLRAARYRMRAWADLAARNTFGGFNGMSKMILEHETMSDFGEAVMDMDGLSDGRDDNPHFQLEGLPLPITHSDFWIDARRLAISRNTGTPLDSTKGEAAGRRVAEMVEKVTIGVTTGLTYGGNSTQVGGYGRTSQVYGYTNFSARQTRTLAGRAPTGSGWTASRTLADVLACLDQLKGQKFFGPFMVYTSNDWDQYLDNDYILSGGNVATQTLRNRLRAIEGIEDVKRLDFLFSAQPETDTSNAAYTGPGGESLASTYPFTMIFVQMTPDVARAVNGMDITTMQWESVGGMRLNFKTMCIQVPQLRADFYDNCGILHATFT